MNVNLRTPQDCVVQTTKYQVRAKEAFHIHPNPSQPRQQLMAPQHVPRSESESGRSIFYHAFTLYLFTCNNLKDIVVLGYGFGVLGSLSGPSFGFGAPKSSLDILRLTPAMLFWSWINLLLFNLHNQRHPEAIHEDSVNKPWRPLPAKRLTPTEATCLMYWVYPVVILSSAISGGLGPCLLEAFSCLWYNEWGGAENPLLKNLLNAAGFACFLAGPLEIASGSSVMLGESRTALQWLGVLGAAIFSTVHTQDFRDQDGDRMRKRQTVPLMLGDGPARWVAVAGVVCCSWAAAAFWRAGVVGSLVPAGAGMLLVWNLLSKRTVSGDVFTWKLWPVWMGSLFLLPLLGTRGGA